MERIATDFLKVNNRVEDVKEDLRRLKERIVGAGGN